MLTVLVLSLALWHCDCVLNMVITDQILFCVALDTCFQCCQNMRLSVENRVSKAHCHVISTTPLSIKSTTILFE